MKVNKLGVVAVVLILMMLPAVLAQSERLDVQTADLPLGKVTKIPLSTCAGDGELFLYEGVQTQEADVLFQTDLDELLVFTRSNYVSDVKINFRTPATIFDETNPIGVKIYKTSINSIGGFVYADITSSKAARGVQAYLAQDSENPIYDPSNFNVVYDGEQEDVVWLTAGTYQYVFYGKYDKQSDGVTDDSRELTVTVRNGKNQVISTTTYTKPFPVGTQGVVVHEFSVAEDGPYRVELSTQDSVYWGMFECHTKPEDFCEGAQEVIVLEEELVVLGDGCHHSGRISDSAIINIPETKSYYTTGVVIRGNFKDLDRSNYCQDNEAFYSEMNGQVGPVVTDDSCDFTITEEYLGTFDLEAGQETFYMHTAAACPPDDTAESVELKYICLYDEEEVPEFGVVAAGLALVGAIAGFAIMRRRN